tara:strand:- start:188 stop:322 length:135 start_codon:yes stop_codon:yes gene_type:complete
MFSTWFDPGYFAGECLWHGVAQRVFGKPVPRVPEENGGFALFNG